MTAPQLDPERLAQLLDDAVRQVTAPPDALDRIRHGVRRRRAAHRAGTVLLALAVLAGGGSAALAVTSGPGSPGLGSTGLASSANAPARQQLSTAPTPIAAAAGEAPTSGLALGPAPSPSPSGDSAAKAADPSASQGSVGQAAPALTGAAADWPARSGWTRPRSSR